MDIKYFDELFSLLQPFFDEMGLEKQEGDIYLNDKFAAKIDYDEDKKVIVLKGAKPSEGESLEFITLSQYLFDESHTSRDIKAVAIDFEETIRSELGKKKTAAKQKIAMPTKAAAGETPGIEALTKGFLDFFPQYRETYRAAVTADGKFKFVQFYCRYGTEAMKSLSDGTKSDKQAVKFYMYLEKMYAEGEKDVGAVISTVLFGGTYYNDVATFDEKVMPKLEGCQYLKSAAKSSIAYVKSNKAARAMFENK